MINRIKNFIANNMKSKFARGVLMISSGTAVAQVLGILLTPIITRIYLPDEYGLLAIYTAILVVLSLGSFSYELGIPISKDDDRAINLLTLCIIVLTTYVIVISSLLLFSGEWFLNLFESSELYNYRFFIPIGVFFSGLFQIFRQWAFRDKNFKGISQATINQSLVGNTSKIALGLAGLGAVGLIIGRILTVGMGIATLTKGFFNKQENITKRISRKLIVWNLKRYKSFPIYHTPTKFLLKIGQQIPILFMTSLYGVTISGLYGLAANIVMQPMNLIGDSVGDVFYSEAASIGQNNPYRIKNLSKKLIKKLAFIGLLPVIVLVLFGTELFVLVFGDNWLEAGSYARILSLLLYSRFIFVPVSRVFTVFEKQKERLILNIVRIVLITSSYLISWKFQLSSHGAVTLYTIVATITYFIDYLWAQRIIHEAVRLTKNELI